MIKCLTPLTLDELDILTNSLLYYIQERGEIEESVEEEEELLNRFYFILQDIKKRESERVRKLEKLN